MEITVQLINAPKATGRMSNHFELFNLFIKEGCFVHPIWFDLHIFEIAYIY